MFICPECRSVYHEPIKLCERDQGPLVAVQANQNVRTYPLLNQELDGRYHLIGGLGQGGVGTVYLANHIHLDQLSAVKFLDVDQLGQADDEQRAETLSDFVKEAKLAMLLRHDSVVRVMDYGVFEGSPFLVMEYIPGPSLLRQINSGQSFSIQQCLNVIYKLADALNAFHERKLVHRDLKPANVIVDPRDNGQLTLVDLGLVKDLSTEARSSTHPLALRGTPGYLAPEQVPSWVLSSAGVEVTSEKKKIDSRVDIYALGVLAYELITGKTPYPKGLSATKVIIHACTQDPPPIEQLRPELKDYPGFAQLVKNMMAKSPDLRPLDGREVMQRIEEILEDGQEPMALREELERAQNALAKRMAVASGAPALSSLHHGVQAYHSPAIPTPPHISLTNTPSAIGSLIAPPLSMTGAHQAIQIDEHLDQLVNSPQLTNPLPIEGVERSAPRLARYAEEEAGLETHSEADEPFRLTPTHDAFSESNTTEFAPRSQEDQSIHQFYTHEATVASFSEMPIKQSSSRTIIYAVATIVVIGGVALGWNLTTSSSANSTSKPLVQPKPLSLPSLPVPQTAQTQSVLSTNINTPKPFQPQMVLTPSSEGPVVVTGNTISGNASSSPRTSPSPATNSSTASSTDVQSVAKQSQKIQKITSSPTNSNSKSQSKSPQPTRNTQKKKVRNTRRSSTHKNKPQFKTLDQSKMRYLLLQVNNYRDRGDVDRARQLVRREMNLIDPKSPEYQTLNFLWVDLNR